MPQNISDYSGFSTEYDTGVPTNADDASIAEAFARYHYGTTYAGVGDPEGIEGYLRGLAAAINAILPPQTGNDGKYLKTNGTSTSWDTPAGGGGGLGDWTAFTPTMDGGWVAGDETYWKTLYLPAGPITYLHLYMEFSTGSTFGTDNDTALTISDLPVTPMVDIFTAGTCQINDFVNGHVSIGTVVVDSSGTIYLNAPTGLPMTYNELGWTSVGGSIAIDVAYLSATGE